MLDIFLKMLYKLLVLFHCFPVFKSIALLSSCLLVAFVSFMKVKVLRDLQEQTSFKAFILCTNLQHWLLLLHFHVAISNVVAHCIVIPLGCQDFQNL